jgi:hypothetical protein
MITVRWLQKLGEEVVVVYFKLLFQPGVIEENTENSVHTIRIQNWKSSNPNKRSTQQLLSKNDYVFRELYAFLQYNIFIHFSNTIFISFTLFTVFIYISNPMELIK